MLVSDLNVWHVLGMGVIWGCGTAFLVSRALLHVQRGISLEVKSYLGKTLLEHRNEATRIVGGAVSQQLTATKEDLRVALADVVKAEAAQLVAEDESKAKTEFMSRMSHEIRTPINGIIGSLDLIDLDELEPDVVEDIDRAMLSSHRLLNIVNELLDFSKSESSEIEYKKIRFDLDGLCNDVIDRMMPLARGKGLSLGLDWCERAKGRGVRVGDEQKINQVLINLIGNSVKFTEKGYVRLKIFVEEGFGDFVGFQVVDTGIGIPHEKQKHVFEEFTQLESPNTRKNGGTGLGLAISQKFVEGMGGKVALKSQLGEGSTFSFVLHLPLVREKTVSALVVDDDAVNRRVVEKYLEKMDRVTVELAVDGNEAVNKCKGNKYDIIFMDVQMPNVDGIEATKIIRASENGEDVRIVSLTASLIGDIESKCMDAGMNGYITKPFSVADIQSEIEKVR